MRNIHKIYTTEATRLHDTFGWLRLEKSYDLSPCNLNVYVTKEDEDIHENDFIITRDGRLVHVTYLLSPDLEGASKVVLTSDQALVSEGVQSTGDDFLKWLVNNPGCESVEVKYDAFEKTGNISVWEYQITIPTEETIKRLEKFNKKYPKEGTKEETPKEASGIILENLLEENYELNVQFHKSMRESIFCFAVAIYDEKLPFGEWEKKYYGNYTEQPKCKQERGYTKEQLLEAFSEPFGQGALDRDEYKQRVMDKLGLDKFEKK